MLVRPSAVTHSFNQDQRLVALAFSTSPGAVHPIAPPSPNLAPPGYYMLFLLSSRGVPSEAVFVRLAP